ncbi:MAG TPA: ABC transporter permease [Opitutaceae bacterium]|nr:ABC transporter permease [Opitutaceae bacterium]
MVIPAGEGVTRGSGRRALERATPLVRIRPRVSLSWGEFGELWACRELLVILTLRDIRVRYKQAAIGVVWVAIQPLLTVFVFTLIFGRLARFPSGEIPYPLFAFAGLLSWTYFSQALGRCAASFIDDSHLVSKVYFPRLILPLAATFNPLADFAVATVVLLAVMFGFGVAPTYRVLALPLVLLLEILTVLAFGLWLAAANVHYRDVGHALPFFLQVWMYASPVAYPVDVVPARWQTLYCLNPMVGLISGFRWCLLGTPGVNFTQVVPSVVAVLMILAGGFVLLRKSEETLVDVL